MISWPYMVQQPMLQPSGVYFNTTIFISDMIKNLSPTRHRKKTKLLARQGTPFEYIHAVNYSLIERVSQRLNCIVGDKQHKFYII